MARKPKRSKLSLAIAGVFDMAERNGITRYRISKLTGMGQSNLGKIYSGETKAINAESVVKICLAAGLGAKEIGEMMVASVAE